MPIAIISVLVVIALLGGVFFFSQTNSITPSTQTPAEITNQELVDTMREPESMEGSLESESAAQFKDGSYTVRASYYTPRRVEHLMDITVRVENDRVVDASILYDGKKAETPSHLNFDKAFKSEVIGKPLDAISLSRVGGASLTSTAFNEAMVEVKTEARVSS